MDQLMKIGVLKYLESAMVHALENPVHAGLAAVGVLAATHLLFGCKRRVSVKPSECIIMITGCDSGFGLMTCKKLSSMGYLVVAACLLEQSVTDLQNSATLPIRCDITNAEDVKRLREKIEELMQARNARLWAVVNNAGIANTGIIDWIPSSALRKVMEVNFFALFEVTRAMIPLLKRTKDSRIINISSMAGFYGSYQTSVYCASKHAVEGLGKCLRQELVPWNIHVCHINPGFMNTPIIATTMKSSLDDLTGAPKEIVEQYDLRCVDKLQKSIDMLKDDPVKVVNKIVDNITLAKPAFNNPVGNGCGTFWLVIRFLPQCVLWGMAEWSNRQQGLGPKAEAVKRIQK